MEKNNKTKEKPKYTFEMLIEAQLETAKQIKEMSVEAEKRRIEADKRQVEADKRMKKLDEKLEKTNIIVNGIAHSNGLVAEQAIYNALERDMTFAGIKFYDIEANLKLKVKRIKLEGEFDIVMENTDTLLLMGIKYKVRKEHILDLVGKKLDSFRKLYPIYSDIDMSKYKIILGVGGMSFEDGAEDEAKANGIGIIKVIGDKVEYYTDNIKRY